MGQTILLSLKRLYFVWKVFLSDFKKSLDHVLNLFSSLACFLVLTLLVLEFAFPPASSDKSFYFTVHEFILFAFFLDVALRFIFFSKRRLLMFVIRPTDLLVIFPWLLEFLIPVLSINFFTSQVILLLLLLGRLGHLGFLLDFFKVRPAQFIIFAFIFLIFIGSLLLSLPNASVDGVTLSYIDALFTACSAVCVTGLSVNDVGKEFTLFGQLILLFLIQIGGLGIMSFSVLVSMLLGKRIPQADTLKLQESYSTYNLKETFSAIAFIFKFTVFFELIGAVFLALFTFNEGYSLPARLFYSLFHSVSAFCNAGFSLFSDSLIGFQTHFPTILTVSLLIIFGGLGFPVLFNLYQRYANKATTLKIGTKLALMVTGVLIVLGTVGIYLIESQHSLSHLATLDKIQVAYFQAVSARTAGFNSIDLSGFYSPAIMLLLGLMIVGASPGSTGGGIKTTAFGLMAISFWNVLKSSFRFDFDGRTIDVRSVLKSFTLFIISFMIIFAAVFVLLYTEKLPFKALFFEAVSAFGTVGFSLGATTQLSPLGKGLMILLMFIGRIGPLTFLYSLFKPQAIKSYEYPVEKVSVV